MAKVVLSELLFNVRADTAVFQKDIKKAEKHLDGMGKRLDDIGKKATLAFAPVTATITGLAVAGARYANTLNDVAQKLKMSAEALQVLRVTAQENHVTNERLEKGLRNVTDRTLLAASGNKAYQEAIEDLGFTTEEFLAMPIERKFASIGRSYVNATDKAKAHNAVMKLVGTMSGPELIKTLEAVGIEGYDALAIRAKAAGRVLDEETVKRLSAFIGQIDALKVRVQVLGAEIGDRLIVRFRELDNAFGISDKVKALTEWFDGLSEGTKSLLLNLGLLAAAAGPTALAVGGLAKAGALTIAIYGKVVVAIKNAAAAKAAETIATKAATAATISHTFALDANLKAQIRAQRANARYIPELTQTQRLTGLATKATRGFSVALRALPGGPLTAILATYMGTKAIAEWLTKNADERRKKAEELGNALAGQNHAIIEQVGNMRTAADAGKAATAIAERQRDIESELFHATGDRRAELEASLRLMNTQARRIDEHGGQIIAQNLLLDQATEEEKRRNKLIEDRTKFIEENKKEIEKEFDKVRLSMLPDEGQFDELQKRIDKLSYGKGAKEYFREAMAMAERIEDGEEREASILRTKKHYMEMLDLEKQRDAVKDRIDKRGEDVAKKAQAAARLSLDNEVLRLKLAGDHASSIALERDLERREKIRSLVESTGKSEAEINAILTQRQRMQDTLHKQYLVAEYEVLRRRAAGQEQLAKDLEREIELRKESDRLVRENENLTHEQAANYLLNKLALQDKINAALEKENQQIDARQGKLSGEDKRAQRKAEAEARRQAKRDAEPVYEVNGRKLREREMNSIDREKAGLKSYVRDGAAAVGMREGDMDRAERIYKNRPMRSVTPQAQESPNAPAAISPGSAAVQQQVQQSAQQGKGSGDSGAIGQIAGLMQQLVSALQPLPQTIATSFPGTAATA